MRKAILMVLLTAMCSRAMADWVAIDDASYGRTYVKPGTISKSGELVKVWELIDLKQSREHEGKSFFSFTSEVEYDCVRKTFQVLNTAGLTEHMAKGEVIAGGAGPRQWRPVTGGTAAENSWRFVCGKK